MEENYIHKELTEKIIRCFYNVHDVLGSGFLGSVYENSVAVELEELGLRFEVQKPLVALQAAHRW